jgi:tRNA U38,U39,U40 pseudouridine synthase TruA
VGPAELQAAINQQLLSAIPAKQPLHNSSSSSSEALGPSCQARVWHVAEVDREFHATFSAQWRRYVYLLPLRQQQQQQELQGQQSDALLPKFTDELTAALQQPAQQAAAIEPQGQQQDSQQQQQHQQLITALQEADVDPAKVNALLQQLQCRQVNYYAYARDTPRGKDCECTLHVARASLVHLPAPAAEQQGQLQQPAEQAPEAAAGAQQQGEQQQQQQQRGVPCLCIELAGDRFLRRMVRVLVATAVREALLLQQGQADAGVDAGTGEGLVAASPAAAAEVGGSDGSGQGCSSPGLQALVALAESMDRQATAPPAPALGLCFAAVGY